MKDEKAVDFLLARSTVEGWSSCWVWQKGVNDKGYPHATVSGKTWRAHRLSYLLAYGSLDSNLVVGHRCNVRLCINPIHLEQVTQAENLRRKVRVPKVKCPRGHLYDERNTYHYRGKTACRTCHRARTRRWSEEHRAKS